MVKIRSAVSLVGAFWVLGILLCGCAAPAVSIRSSAGDMPDPSARQLEEAVTSARSAMYRTAQSEVAPMRAAAMESLGYINASQAGRLLTAGLNDSAASVRFAAAMSLGNCRHEPARAHLEAMLVSETDKSVQASIAYALYKLGDGRHLKILGKLLCDDSPEVRANAAVVIGMTGIEKGASALTGRLEFETHHGVKQRIAESLAMLGVGEGFSMLFNYARVGEPHQQVESITALGLTGDYPRCAAILGWALNDSFAPPQRIAAASSLGKLGDSRGFGVAMAALTNTRAFCIETCGKNVYLDAQQDAQLTAFAALALGDIGKLQAIGPLAEYMSKSRGPGIVSAAKAILQIADKNKIVVAEQDFLPDLPVSAANNAAGQSELPQMFTAPPRK